MQKQNIIFINTDDQRPDTVKHMPNVRRLASGGTSFNYAFPTTNLCCPSRASALTGQYASTHGVKTSVPPNGGFPAFKDSSTIATWLDEAGYKTGLFGKYLNGYEGTYKPPGWDRWHAVSGKFNYYNYSLSENGTVREYGDRPRHYSTDLIGRKATSFVKRSLSGKKPFFMIYTPFAPHAPFTPAPRHAEMDVPSWKPAPNFNEADVSDKPSWLQQLPLLSHHELSQEWESSIRALQSVDEVVGKMFALVKDAKQLKNTVFIYTSDNGKGLGEHRWDRKASPYEESKMPLIIRAPGLQVQTTDQIGLNIDMAPTIASFAGVNAPGAEGIDLSPALMGDRLGRNSFFLENWAGSYKNKESGPQPFFGIRTPQWKLINYQETGEQELYNLKLDPWEMSNLASDPKYAEVIQRLSDRIQAR